jgi:putative exosortase-associated protein (TIGR04073 family)
VLHGKKKQITLAKRVGDLLTMRITRMKKRIVLTLTAILALGSIASADIQSPPGGQFNWSRKLSRALSNLAYAPFEIPNYAIRSLRTHGNVGSSAITPIEGLKRTGVRIGYGVFELVTFPGPTYKHTFRPPYPYKQNVDPWYGYSEFPPQFGVSAEATYCRTQSW